MIVSVSHETIAKALYEDAIAQPGCLAAKPWAQLGPKHRAHYFHLAAVAARAMQTTTWIEA